MVIASIAACRTVTRSSSISTGPLSTGPVSSGLVSSSPVSSGAVDHGRGISTMLVPRCSTTWANPARKPIAYGSEKAYDNRSVSSTPTASVFPLRNARAAASGPA